MNHTARAAADAVKKTVSQQPNTVMAFITGSQADGSATERSDLDIYCVMDGGQWGKRQFTEETAAGGIDVDLTNEPLEAALTNVRWYGSYGYWAAHCGILLFENRDSGGWRTLRGAIDGEILPDCADRWLEYAGRAITIAKSDMNGGDAHLSCVMYAKSIYASLAAVLIRDGVEFRFTKRPAEMAALLRDRSIIDGHDLDAANPWMRARLFDTDSGFTADDSERAARIACSVYHSVNTLLQKSAGASVPHQGGM